MTKEQVENWLGGFEAIAAEDRREQDRRRPDPRRSLDLSLSLISVARDLASAAPDRIRNEGVAEVRETWFRLRERRSVQ